MADFVVKETKTFSTLSVNDLREELSGVQYSETNSPSPEDDQPPTIYTGKMVISSHSKPRKLCNFQHPLKTSLAKYTMECDICACSITFRDKVSSCDRCDYDLCEKCGNGAYLDREPCIVFSAHGDTCFGESYCVHVPSSKGALLFGHMDNASGVYAMTSAYFTGRLPSQRVQCQVTYGEEKAIQGVSYCGARDLMSTLIPNDFVAVIDVTGVGSLAVNEENIRAAAVGKLKGHVVIEKVRSDPVTLALLAHLEGKCTYVNGVPYDDGKDLDCAPYTYETNYFCSDPQAVEDETDAYNETQRHTVFLGIPTNSGRWGELESDGDYNEGPVFCWKKDIDAMSTMVVELGNIFVQQYERILRSTEFSL